MLTEKWMDWIYLIDSIRFNQSISVVWDSDLSMLLRTREKRIGYTVEISIIIGWLMDSMTSWYGIEEYKVSGPIDWFLFSRRLTRWMNDKWQVLAFGQEGLSLHRLRILHPCAELDITMEYYFLIIINGPRALGWRAAERILIPSLGAESLLSLSQPNWTLRTKNPSFVRLSKRSCRSLNFQATTGILVFVWNLTARQPGSGKYTPYVRTSSTECMYSTFSCHVGKRSFPSLWIVEFRLFSSRWQWRGCAVATVPRFATCSATDSKIVYFSLIIGIAFVDPVNWLWNCSQGEIDVVYVPTLQGSVLQLATGTRASCEQDLTFESPTECIIGRENTRVAVPRWRATDPQ